MASNCEETYNCLDNHKYFTQDYNLLKHNLCCIQKDIEFIGMMNEAPPQLVADSLTEISVALYSVVRMVEKIDTRVKNLGG